MKKKMSKNIFKRQKWLQAIITSFIFIMTVTFTNVTYATNGNLDINNQVINDTGATDVNAAYIEYQVAPDLFLEKKTEVEVAKETETREKIEEAKEQNFIILNHQQEKLDTASITKTLFSEELKVGTTYVNSEETTHSFTLPSWLGWVLITAVMILAVVGGILLGKRFSKIFVKKVV
jgi:magnesium-transporting ATPase (P-type)